MVGFCFLLLPFALTASAHASLLDSDPADGQHLDESPERVLLTFNEAVELPAAAIRVYDSRGARVDRGEVRLRPGARQVELALPVLPDGGYVTTWHVISADGHPARGAIVFQVGHGPAQVDPGLVDSLLQEERSVPLAFSSWALRWVAYLAGLSAAGALVFILLVGTPRRGVVTSSIRLLAMVGVLASVLQILVFAAESSGLGWSTLTSASAMRSALGSSVALAALVRGVALMVISSATLFSMDRMALLGVAGVVVAELLTGHTRTTIPAGPMLASTAVHVLAAAVWLGGLLALYMSIRSSSPDEDPIVSARMVARFSALGLWSVVVVSVAGLAMARIQVGSPAALTTTPYGLSLLAKSGVAVLVVAAAWYNRRRLVPRIIEVSGSGDGGEHAEPGRALAWKRLIGTVRIELIGLVVVVGVTALLVSLQPAVLVAVPTGPYTTTVPFGDLVLEVVVDPARAGENEIHIYLTTPGGLSPVLTGAFTMELRMPAEEIGPFVRPLDPAGPGHFLHSGSEMTIPGEWTLTLRHRVSQFDEVTADLAIPISP